MDALVCFSCEYNSHMLDWSQCPAVERTPQKVSGAWVFKGTRVPVNALFENIEDGARLDKFLDWFPGVTREQAEAVLEHARAQPRRGIAATLCPEALRSRHGDLLVAFSGRCRNLPGSPGRSGIVSAVRSLGAGLSALANVDRDRRPTTKAPGPREIAQASRESPPAPVRDNCGFISLSTKNGNRMDVVDRRHSATLTH